MNRTFYVRKTPEYSFDLYGRYQTCGPIYTIFILKSVALCVRTQSWLLRKDGWTDRHSSKVLEFRVDQTSPRNLGVRSIYLCVPNELTKLIYALWGGYNKRSLAIISIAVRQTLKKTNVKILLSTWCYLASEMNALIKKPHKLIKTNFLHSPFAYMYFALQWIK